MNVRLNLFALSHVKITPRIVLFAWLISLSSTASAALDIVITESTDESAKIEVISTEVNPDCVRFQEGLGISKTSERVFRQPLNSEVGEEAQYLIAARQGGGIYMYLPYFKTNGTCGLADFTIKARHILWNGLWHSGLIKVPAISASGKAVFFTNEELPRLAGSIYIDPEISSLTAENLRSAFKTIIAFYKSALDVEPLQDVGVVVAISRNRGRYSGFGGDSLNIIRMSYDNPKPEHMAELGQIFPATFAHELAHKLQRNFLFTMPQGRYISEGSADFLKIVILLNSGLIDSDDAKNRVLKALKECSKFANSNSIQSKIEKRSLNYREPYDCGMVYYFVAYYSSGLSGREFLATLLRGLAGVPNYSDKSESICLLFEANCRNERLRGIAGDKSLYEVQSDWLKSQLEARGLPSIN